VITFMVSAFWHVCPPFFKYFHYISHYNHSQSYLSSLQGFYPAYYVVFGAMAFHRYVSQVARKKMNLRFLRVFTKKQYDIITTFCTCFAMTAMCPFFVSYCCFSFLVLIFPFCSAAELQRYITSTENNDVGVPFSVFYLGNNSLLHSESWQCSNNERIQKDYLNYKSVGIKELEYNSLTIISLQFKRR
jgi:hypothetical protein